MKKIIFTLLCLIVYGGSVLSQSTDFAVIKGKIQTTHIPEFISLYKVQNGDVIFHSKVQVSPDGSFGFVVMPDPAGLYRIGERNSSTRLYLSPGKNISIQISDSNFIVNKSEVENTKLQEWNNILWPLKKTNQLIGNYTYKEIFPILPDIEKQKNDFLTTIDTGNNSFDRLLKGLVQAEFEYELYHFLFMPRIVHPSATDLPELYNRLSTGTHFATTEVLSYDFGQSYVSMYLQYLISFKNKPSEKPVNYLETIFKLCVDNVKNDTIKGWYLINNILLRAKTYDQIYRGNLAKIKPYILTTDQKAALIQFEKTIRKFEDGEPAINFEGNTVDGKKVSLSDFTGKVVLVDVWATWCGPCKKEIPSLKSLEEEFYTKNVVFISYSIDELKDLAKWKKMVVDENLKGVQLIGDAAWKSPICTNYSITGIPRFLVFSKKGTIVTIDAPRPSSPELKALLEKELSK